MNTSKTPRTEYVEQIKTFLRETPNFSERMEEMRLKALISGATEQEFDEALKEFPNASPKVLGKPIKPYMKKLVALDVAVHVIFIVVAVGSISLVASLFSSGRFPTWLSRANETAAVVNTEKDTAKADPLLPPVYANTLPVNSKRVFSYPASNITLTLTGTPKREVFGFLPYWMVEDENRIDLTGLTTISYFGLEVDGGGNIVTSYVDGTMEQGWGMWNNRLLDIAIKRAKQKRLKTQLTIKAFNKTNIEQLVSSNDAQKTFITNTIHLLNSKALDGITIDFEYVGSVDPAVRDGFTRLITNLRAEMLRQVPKAQLSVATYVNAASQPGFFDIELLSQQVDDFVIMGYDFHTPKGSPGPIAPMEGTVSLKTFMQSYLEKVPAEKLILALAYYGYDWPIAKPEEPQQNAAMLSYAEIAALSTANTISWDDVAQTPYFQYTDQATSQQRIVHYENTRSLGIKYDYVNEKNLKGVGIWALGYDGLNNDLRALLLDKFAK